MKTQSLFIPVLGLALAGASGLVHAEKAPPPPQAGKAHAAPADLPPPLSPEKAVKAGLDYLLSQQHDNGGWGQGGGWRQNVEDQQGRGARVEGDQVKDPPDLGNTCVSLMALLRAGHSPVGGGHQEAAQKAFKFICAEVDKADVDSLFVTSVRDTQLQSKIGTYVDTFLAAWVLSELKGHVDDKDEPRRAALLDKVIQKMERHQEGDGSFAGNQGWAAVLSQGLCSKAFNRAAQNGAKVSQSALDKDQGQNIAGVDLQQGFTAAAAAPAPGKPSDAGISIYRESSKLGGLMENSRTNAIRRGKAEKVLEQPDAPAEEKAKAKADLEKIANDDAARDAAAKSVLSRLADERYVAGFGNNGGEEFLSYMNLAEMMHEKGGEDWKKWRESMIQTLTTAQNADGSWSGHHCITGRTFCTSTALLTLTVERLSAPKAVEVTTN
ncbi:MAG: hypothetical protein HS117_02355 [Verrucomicrobiaceae bacterium]|nr:hypothetical protein [Verrucomicrobiaceae bacterium]